jgi:hypothetical protein
MWTRTLLFAEYALNYQVKFDGVSVLNLCVVQINFFADDCNNCLLVSASWEPAPATMRFQGQDASSVVRWPWNVQGNGLRKQV